MKNSNTGSKNEKCPSRLPDISNRIDIDKKLINYKIQVVLNEPNITQGHIVAIEENIQSYETEISKRENMTKSATIGILVLSIIWFVFCTCVCLWSWIIFFVREIVKRQSTVKP